MDATFRPALHTARKLIEAKDEKEIVQTLLQTSLEITGAEGASFVPLDERGYPLALTHLGQFPGSIPDAWLEYLATPPVRQKCSQCGHKGRLVKECQLIAGPFSAASGIYCFPVYYEDHELGILNLYMPAPAILDVLELMEFLIESSALAIANDRLRRRELAMFTQFRSVRSENDHESPKNQLDRQTCVEDRLAEVEYRILMEERTRLAREIHDGLAQTLGFLKLQASQLISSLEKNQSEQMKQLSLSLYDALADAYLDAREAINMLRVVPGEPGDARLVNWLSRMIEGFRENTDLQVNLVEYSVQRSFPNEVHLQMIRIIQEALINVRKHAQAHQVQISCREIDQVFVVEVKDDGQGFCADEVPEPSQHGLRGMRERAGLIGADLEFISQPQQGTTVRLTLPIQPEWGNT